MPRGLISHPLSGTELYRVNPEVIGKSPRRRKKFGVIGIELLPVIEKFLFSKNRGVQIVSKLRLDFLRKFK
jgi:hypothetical protein